jgi:hypothetical protein
MLDQMIRIPFSAAFVFSVGSAGVNADEHKKDNFEIRIPKFETNYKSETIILKIFNDLSANFSNFNIIISDLFRISLFRHSNFYFVAIMLLL